MVTLDFDGTTADTMPTLEKTAVRLITATYDLTDDDARTKYRRTSGLPFVQQINILFPNNPNNDEVVTQFEQEKVEGIFDLPLFDDAKETLTHLRDEGYLVAISSSTIQSILEKFCKKSELKVDQILGYRPGFEKGKHHFDYLKEKFKLLSSEMVYIGDSLKDCERAQGSNILFIGKIGMFTREHFNEISTSNITINTLSELKELIPKISRDLD
ncbi:MAG: HAD family hydrolase [Candidatus Heimdallarchaeota archaeon]